MVVLTSVLGSDVALLDSTIVSVAPADVIDELEWFGDLEVDAQDAQRYGDRGGHSAAMQELARLEGDLRRSVDRVR